jgi:hypothetical protein
MQRSGIPARGCRGVMSPGGLRRSLFLVLVRGHLRCFGRAVVLDSSVSFNGFANSSRNTAPVFLEKPPRG